MNPILPGFHPDPSICRAGDDFYVVTSSFEYFPGVPIFHSLSLTEWKQIGHVLTRESQLALQNAKSSQGIFAPTLRYHDGTFYMITTNMSAGRSFYVTSTDPAGEWSDPIWVQEEGFSMDPSLFFDDDGKVYYTRHGGGRNGGVYQAEIEIDSGRLDAPPRHIWAGTGGIWPEGPHLYKIGQTYYLLIAEGGTSYDHEVTVARASSPWGPFEACARNPILTHKAHRSHPIQATGHADWVQAANGSWWLVFLGIRPWDGAHHHLGRETFLTPMTWDGEGWPLVNAGKLVDLNLEVSGLPESASSPRTAVDRPLRDDFDEPALGLEWNFVRNPVAANYSLSERPGFLRLRGTSATLADEAAFSFVGRRQQHYRCRVSAHIEFEPRAPGQAAGLVVRADEKNHYQLLLRASAQGRQVVLHSRIQGKHASVGEAQVRPGPVVLGIDAYPERYEFFVLGADGARLMLGSLPTKPLASEVTGGFTGAYFGMVAVDDSGEPGAADFDWFDYRPARQE